MFQSEQKSNPDMPSGTAHPQEVSQNLMIASAVVNTDCDIPVRIANVFPKALNIKSGKVLAVCEPVTKIFHHKEELSDTNDEEMKRNW